MTEFTKEQLVELTREDVEFWRERDELIPSWQTALRLRQAEITLAALTDGTEQEAVYQVRHGDQWRDLDKVQYNDHVNLGAEGLRIVYAAPQLPQPAMMTPNYSRFLSDVMTAAGLLSHGRRDKALATRLADFCVAERMGMDAPCCTAMLKESHRDLSYPVDMQVAEYEKIMQLALPDGWAAVPVEPTEDMVIAGFEAELREEFRNPEAWEAFEAMSGCEQAAHRAKLCWAAMIAAVPQQETKI